MKKTTALIMTGCLAGMLAACGNTQNTTAISAAADGAEPTGSASAASAQAPADNGKPTEIVFWNSFTGEIYKTLEEIIAEYNASQNKVHVTSQFQGTYDETLTKFKSSMASGSGPDVLHMYEAGTRYMLDSGYAVPVQDYAAADGFDLNQLNDMARSYYTVDHALWSMPFNYGQAVLFYNKTAFEEAGLDPESPPRTYAEFKDAAQKLMVKKNGKVTRYGATISVYGWFMEQLIAGQGKLYVNNDNGRSGRATALEADKNGALLNVFKEWQSFAKQESVVNFGKDLSAGYQAFVAGKVAMLPFVSGYYNYATAAINGKFKLGVGYFPMLDKTAEGGSLLAGASFWMIDHKDEAKKKASWEFIKYMASKEVQAKWTLRTGDIAINKGSYEMPEVQDYLKVNPAIQVSLNQEKAYPNNNFTQGAVFGVMPEARLSFEENMDKILAGAQTPEQATEKFAADVNKSLADYNASIGK
ncbi:ABC transporter substrate-binding protein [Cohnella ginsengisoli]|uniref:ABC transporter substrate-binding protein n=1 Tax=Cohnella ginsengisoli TaxID=425004 RepID=A0A9X4QNB6_9BACL|nr:ABC transporter substrate-binding protein [Cohnella ginsengisoli]MDG0792618.1 ABC transporter substrate-binding protein [Cohnella ginsengisoli]